MKLFLTLVTKSTFFKRLLTLSFLLIASYSFSQEINCSDGIDNDADGFVDGFDSDCPCSNTGYVNLCNTACSYSFVAQPFALALQYQSSADVPTYATPLMADIDNDGVIEIISMGTTSITTSDPRRSADVLIFNGQTGVLETTISTPLMAWVGPTPIAVADIDGDGFGEIIIATLDIAANGTNANRLLCYEHTGALKWTSIVQYGANAGATKFGSALGITDFNGDGISEVYVYNEIFNALTGVKLADGGANGIGAVPVRGWGRMGNPVAANLTTSPGLELACGSTVYNVVITNTAGTVGNVMTAINNTLSIPDGFTAVADIDLDGQLDVIVASETTSGVSVWNPRTNTMVASFALAAGAIGVPFVGDVDNDNDPDIGVCKSNAIRMLSYNGTTTLAQKWNLVTTDGSGFTKLTMFDFDQDGKQEIVYRDQSVLRIIDGSGASAVTSASIACTSGTGAEGPIVGDIDNDGSAEILVTGDVVAGPNGRVRVYESNGQPWAPARKIWNQYGYFSTHVNDNMTIPLNQQNHGSTFSFTGTCVGSSPRPFNSYMTQSTLLSGAGCPVFNAPDVNITINTATRTCGSNSLTINFRVNNISTSSGVSIGMPISFYTGNPATSSSTYIATTTLSAAVPASSNSGNINATITGAPMGSFTLFAVVNDDGSDPVPITFPITAKPECNYTNNTATITVVNAVLPATPVAASNSTVCSGNTIALTSSTIASATYSWSGPGSYTSTAQNPTISSATPTMSGTYSVVSIDLGCASLPATVAVVVDPIPSVSITAVSSSTICSGNTVTITPAGAANYTLNPGGLTGLSFTVTPSASTTYTLSGATAANCPASNTATTLITVTSTPTVSISSVSSNTICSGNSVTITPNGALGYTLNPGSLTGTSFTVSPTTNTTYSLTGGNGSCAALNTASTAITVNTTPTVSILSVSSNTICSGNSVTITPNGATTYTLNPGSLTGTSFTVSPTGNTTYSLTGVTASCTAANIATTLITVNSLPTVSITSVSSGTICAGNTVTITPGGGTTYTLNPGGLTGTTFTVAPTGNTTYSLTGENALCSATNTAVTTITVTAIPTVSITSLSSNSVCAGNTVTITPGGGTTYTLNPGSLTGTTFTVAPTGNITYSLTGVNASCSASNTAVTTITVNALPTVSITAVSNSTICAGNTVTITPGGATTYTLNPGSLTGTIFTVAPTLTSTYTLTGRNGSCTSINTATTTITVTALPIVSVTSVSSGTICAGNTVTITPGGGTTYTLNPGLLIGTSFTVAPTGNTTYSLTGSNASCAATNTAVTTITVSTPPTVSVTSVSNSIICIGTTVTITPGGGTTYTLNPGSLTGTTFTVAPTGNTTYSLTGANASCTATNTAVTTITVNSLPTVSITAVSSNTICSGNTVTITPGGATSYTLNPGGLTGTAFTVTPSTTTTYTLKGTNASNCTSINDPATTITVNTTPSVSISSVSNSVICSGTTVTITPNGATTYTLNPGSLTGTTFTVAPTGNTTFSLTGSSAFCTATNTAVTTITVNSTPSVSITSVSSNTICSGAEVIITPAGANTYTLNPGGLSGTTFTVAPTVTNTYTLTGITGACTSANIATTTITVNTTPTVSVASVSNSMICSGETVTITPNGAVTYTLDPGGLTGTTFIVAPIANTTYSLTGSSTFCTASNTAITTITVNTTPTVSILSVSDHTICSGAIVTITPNGATAYTLNPGSLTGTTFTVSPTGNTTYSLTGSTISCIALNTETTSITVNTTPTLTLATTNASICAGASATLTALGADTYSWSPSTALSSTTSETTIATPAGGITYSVTGTSVLGCSVTSTIDVVVNVLPTQTVNSSVVTCAGGVISLSAQGGAASYDWSGPNTFTSSVQNPSLTPATLAMAGTYTVTLTGANGCSITHTVTVNVSSSPTIQATVNGSVTAGDNCIGGSISLSASTGAASYSWVGPNTYTSNTQSASVSSDASSVGIYTVTASGFSGCGASSATATVQVSFFPQTTLTVNATPNTTICAGATLTLSANGANTYTWTSSQITNTSSALTTFTDNVSGDITVSGTDANGCTTITNTISVTVNQNPSVNISVASPSICAGTSATLIADGAITYTWAPTTDLSTTTSATTIATPASDAIYTVTGTDALGCSASATVGITINALPTQTVNASVTSCIGGDIILNAGLGATSYDWSGPNSFTSSVQNPTITPATSAEVGTYTVVITNSNACSVTYTVDVNVTSTPSIQATVNGSVMPSNNCIGGSVSLSATSGASLYDWTGPNTFTANIQNPTVSADITSAGIYTITASGFSGCGASSATATVEVTFFPQTILTVSAIPNATLCAGSTLTLSATGANTYTWTSVQLTDNNSPTTTFTGTTTEDVTVTGIDANGCASLTNTITVTVNANPTLTLTSSSSTLCALSSSTLTAIGATTYSWMPTTNLSTTSSSVTVASPLSDATYSVLGTDALGCSSTGTISLSVFALPTQTVNTSAVSCIGGDVLLSAEPGADSYSWSGPNGFTSSVQNPTLTPATLTMTGTYTVEIVNSNSCSVTHTVDVSVTTSPSVQVTVNGSVTPGNNCIGGSISLTSSSGATTYDWTGPNTFTANVQNPTLPADITSAGIYTITASGFSGCGASSATATVEVTFFPQTTLTVNAIPNTTLCAGSTLTLSAIGANTYTWISTQLSDNNSATTTFTGTTTEDITVTGIDANGCASLTNTVSVTVSSTPTVTINTSPTITICAGQSFTLEANGADTYSWSPSSDLSSTNTASTIATPTLDIIYTVVGTNTLGCSSTETVALTVTALPTQTVIASAVSCSGGDIVLTAESGAVSYSWSGPNGYSSSVQSPTITPATNSITGNYTVVITGAGGCSVTHTVDVNVTSSPSIQATANGSTTPGNTCVGTNVLLDATSGATTYNWTGPNGYTSGVQSPTVTSAGIYTITASGFSGCGNTSATATVQVNFYTQTTITVSAVPSLSVCPGVTIDLTANGATTYTWSSSQITNTNLAATTFTGTSSGIVTVNGTDANGCSTLPEIVSITVYTNCPDEQVGASKTASVKDLGNGVNQSVFTFTVANTGGLTANNVQLTDNLNNTFPSPITYTVVGLNANTPLTANAAYNGNTDIALLSGSDILNVGQNSLITLTVNFSMNSSSLTSLSNSGIASTSSSADPTGGGTHTSIDSTNAGSDPDPDGDGNPNEPGENQPTVFIPIINDIGGDVVVPQGFSPNSDGINDGFVIAGLEKYTDNTIIIFNRWGNVIYKTNGYDNSDVIWKGQNQGDLTVLKSNVTAGNTSSNLVPEATYFYILTYKDGSGDQKKLQGYVYVKY